MPTQPTAIVQRLWNYCNVLRDDGVSYGDDHVVLSAPPLDET